MQLNTNQSERLLPVQPNGMPPLNFYGAETPPRDEPINAFDLFDEKINSQRVLELTRILNEYMEGKKNLENRIVENDQWWKLRHWNEMRRKNENKDEIEPSSAWLLNIVLNKHADALDSYPSPLVLPREFNDKQEAEILSDIIPVILDQCGFEQTYSDVWDSKLKSGTGAYGVFWDSKKHNGLGDIAINKIDLLNLFWEPGITNIQDSKYVFHTVLKDNDELLAVYPELENKLGGKGVSVTKYQYDDKVDTDEKSVVIDCYYKVKTGTRTVLHYVKYCGDTVLYATENVPELADRGIYDHGMYPFELDPLFKQEGTPTGYGYIDIGKSCQEYIDRLDQSIIKNSEANATVRAIVSDSAGINKEEFADRSVEIISAAGNLDDDHFRFIKPPSLDSSVIAVKNNKIEELKEVTGNRDVSTGGTTSGVTAASAIAAMQEASGKLSRDAIKASYRVDRNIILRIMELIRQFYDTQRMFRITGDGASDYRFVSYSNKNIEPQEQGQMIDGIDMGYRVPVFDVIVSAEKQNPYTKMAQNELAIQFYNNGFFNPQMTDQAIACLEMMDFDGKDSVLKKITQNGTLYEQYIARTQQALYLAQKVDMYEGSNYSEIMAAEINGTPSPPFLSSGTSNFARGNPQLGGNDIGESAITARARQRAAESTAPR